MSEMMGYMISVRHATEARVLELVEKIMTQVRGDTITIKKEDDSGWQVDIFLKPMGHYQG